MSLYSEAPEALPWAAIKPSLLVCWWATLFSTVIILLRVAGRFVRSEKLFTEDKMAFLCLIPLYARMGCVHIVLIYGTNNVDFSAGPPGDEELRKRVIGSGLVLASRIFYSATLWMLKNTILEFFKRLSGLTWSKTYQNGVVAVRCVLLATFFAVVVSDLAECHPFKHYWQVFPDPGGQCRQGYANLITIGVCNVLTDLLLVALPVPIIIMSHMTLKRKMQLVLLFSMSLLVVAVTLYRIPQVIGAHGSQRLRSLLASIELLVATGVANALVLGSFVRDRGVKKRRFKYDSAGRESPHATDSVDRLRKPTVAGLAWGSDEDLVRDVGFGLHRTLRSEDSDSEARPPLPAGPVFLAKTFDMNKWNFPTRTAVKTGGGNLAPDDVSTTPSSSGAKRVTFFDVGGLLDDRDSGSPITVRRQSTISSREPLAPFIQPEPAMQATAGGFRRGSQAILQDLGGLLGPFRASRDYNGGGDKEGDGSGSSGTELRDLTPTISPSTQVPPPLGDGSSEPPPYENPTKPMTGEKTHGIPKK